MLGVWWGLLPSNAVRLFSRECLESQADEARTIGADQVVGIDDDNAIANLPMLDFVADTVAKMIGTTRSRVSLSMNSFQK
jgi:hypothetical protein